MARQEEQTTGGPVSLHTDSTETISVELTAAEMEAISKQTPSLGAAQERVGSGRVILLVRTALVTVCAAAIAYLAKASVFAPEVTLPLPVPSPISTPAPAPAHPSDGSVVLFVNPFDKTEIFEFPPGTSEKDAHDAVAEILLTRAKERRHGGTRK
jgi:hypothetical protein